MKRLLKTLAIGGMFGTIVLVNNALLALVHNYGEPIDYLILATLFTLAGLAIIYGALGK